MVATTYIAMSYLTFKQRQKIKSPIVDINYHLNQVLPVFDSLNKELSPGFQLVNIFSNCFFFNIVKHKGTKVRTTYLNKLKNIYQGFSNITDIVFIISDTSVQNNIATFISHIQKEYNIITRTIHYAMNVLFTKAELFAIRCGISQVTQIQDVT